MATEAIPQYGDSICSPNQLEFLAKTAEETLTKLPGAALEIGCIEGVA